MPAVRLREPVAEGADGVRMCMPHWERLRVAIADRGLSALVAESGEQAARNLASEVEDGPSIDNFDPLMSAHNAIAANAMDTLGSIGANPLMLLTSDPDHPEYECPICCLNALSAEHDATCTEPSCQKPKGLTFDDWIDKAADGAAEQWKALRP